MLADKTFQLPEGACDCHVHIYGPYDRFPGQLTGRFAPPREYPVEDLLALWDRLGVDRGVIVHALNAGADNEVTLDALRRFPKRLRGVAVLTGTTSDSRLDLMTDAGFRGVRVNLLRQNNVPLSSGGVTLEDLIGLAPRLAERGWHAQLWIESGDLDALAEQLEKLPLTFVIDHMGRTMTDKGIAYPGFVALRERLKTGRYWCKVSGADRNTLHGAPYGDTEPFLKALVQANPDRIVWGSDWPHVGHTPETMPDEASLLDLFFRCVPDAAIRNKILIDNPVELYKF